MKMTPLQSEIKRVLEELEFVDPDFADECQFHYVGRHLLKALKSRLKEINSEKITKRP